jgi:lipoprotein
MFRKIVTILIAILLCCATLLSCNYSVDVPTQEDIDFDKINGNYIVSNTDNIVKLDTEYYKGVEIKKVLDDSMDPLVVYLTNDQLDKIKNTYSEDALSLINFSDEEVHDIFKLNQLRADIKNNKEYIFAHYNSNRKIVDNYSYIYYIINLNYYGPVVLYIIYEKDINGEWIYFTDWAYTNGKKNISNKEFFNKELIYNDLEDDMKYFCIISLSSGSGFNNTSMYLNNGYTANINYMSLYNYDNNNVSYEICYRIILNKLSLFDILQEGDEPEEVLKRFNEQAEQ